MQPSQNVGFVFILMFLKWSISQIEHFSNGAILKSNISQMEHFSNGAILKSNISQMEHFSNEAILKSNISQMKHFSNRAFLKWSNSQIEHFSNGAILKWSILGSPPYAIFQDPKNREIWHAMCYHCPANEATGPLGNLPTINSTSHPRGNVVKKGGLVY